MQKRNVGLMVIISILTCGIGFWYWFYKIASDVYTLTNSSDSAVLDLIISICTCGLALFYFVYKYDSMIAAYQMSHDMPVSNNGLICIVLGLFGLFIISFAIIDNEVGKIIDSKYF